MKDISLFEHNENAYEKLIKDLKRYKCTTINHATGTGKSFIALKYLYEHNDKRYLYLAPTYPIIDQLLESSYKIGITPEDLNIDTMTYRNLLEQDIEKIYNKYDGFIFDEYHRTGAKETYKKIKQLKLLLEEGKDEKKLIGLTATPIRYLDKERNMTQEIFDGHVASSISLSEAMLEELLPVPTYINSKIAVRPVLEKAITRVKKMAPTIEKEKLLKRLFNIDKKTNNGINDKKQLVNKYIKEKDGKYIIFCNNIEALNQYYKEVDEWFKDFGPIKKYVVHSRNEVNQSEKKEIKNIKEKNKKNLDAFNKEKKGISVLLCVDILNEGVHVDDIDGIFMLRKTTSPIIYFQQIGRALSFSGRKKEIKIFDLVNNFNNHMAIDMIYQELHEEYEKRIKECPENKEKYEKILKNFKIMDETKALLKDISDVKNEVTKEKIIESKIDYSIDVLNKFVKSGKKTFDLFQNEDTKKAYTTIARYDVFVNNKQFEKLLGLNIVLPEKISMTMEERENLLDGYDSIHEKINSQYKDCITEVIEFIKNNNRIPDIKSEDENEKDLSRQYLGGIVNIDEKQIIELKKVCEEKNIVINGWEKAIFNKKINRSDLNQIMGLSQEFINNKKEIPGYLKLSIEKIIRGYNIKENVQLFELLKQSENIKQEKLEKEQKVRYELLNKIDKYLQEHLDDDSEELNQSEIMDIIKELKPRDVRYIKIRFEALKKAKFKQILSDLGEISINEFCKKMKYVEKDQLSIYYDKIEQSKKINNFIIELTGFINENDGKYPSSESKDEKEKKLADQLAKYYQSEEMRKRFVLLEKDKSSKFYKPQDMMYKIAKEEQEQNEVKSMILKCIEFLQTYGRRPLPNSDDDGERKLANEYEKKCINKLSNSDITILNRIFNNKNNFQKTCDEYIKNIKAKEEPENSR